MSVNPGWIAPGPGITREQIDTSVASLWRYRAAFCGDYGEPISLGEGRTPLVEGAWEGSRPLFKLDFLNPTGSFKDRGSSVMLSYLRARGVSHVVEDSSGNGGSSVAGYAAAGGMRASIFAPSSTSSSKLAQARAYGADVVLVPGPRGESQRAAMAFADLEPHLADPGRPSPASVAGTRRPDFAGTHQPALANPHQPAHPRQPDLASAHPYYAGHNWEPQFLQGTKTLAYEVWEDLGFSVPDNVIVPVGAGSSLLGFWLGFRELVNSGEIARLPRLFAVQPWNCSPLDVAFRARVGGTSPNIFRPVLPTLAEGAAIAQPPRLSEMIQALRESNGGTVAVTEDELAVARDALARQGLFVEPTSALAAAAQTLLLADGTIRPEQTTVILLTGSGLKTSG